GDLYLVRASTAHRADESVWWSRDDPDAGDDVERPAAAAAPAPTDDGNITQSLDRIAATIDRLAAQIAEYNAERAEHLDAIEFLLKELVLGGAASAPRPVVYGGVVDPDAIEPPTPDITIIAEHHLPLDVDTPVEVRSRFHDRWIYGFVIAEAIENG